MIYDRLCVKVNNRLCCSLEIVISCDSGLSTADYVLLLCVCVHMCVIIAWIHNISKSYGWILIKFCGEVVRVPGRNWLHFGDDPVSFVDAVSFSSILYH